jgi:YD repeat-containing protein
MGLLWLVLAQAAFSETVTITYHYDALGRLDSVDHGTGSRSSFAYDPAGNITQLSVAASGTDTTPDAFSFPQKTAMPLDTLMTSAPMQITGINAPASWTTSGGWACVGTTNASNCGCADTDVASSGTINNGEYICARHFTPPSYSAQTFTTVTVGGVSAQFQTTTVDPGTDATPDPFSFTTKTGVALATTTTSDRVQITGINRVTSWSVSGGTACASSLNTVNCGCTDNAFTASGEMLNNEYICARHTSSSSYSTTTTTTVTVGGVSSLFQSNTIAFSKLGQIISFGAAPSVIVGGTAKVSATGGASGNPVIFSSTTPLVCSISGSNGSTVTGLAVGNCIIAANQAGNDNYNASPTVTQSFNVTVGITLTVNNLNPTLGTITSNPLGIMCGATCSSKFASGTLITLTAIPNSNDYQFTGWGGNCSGYGNSAKVTLDAAKSCTANFAVFKKKRRHSWFKAVTQ